MEQKNGPPKLEPDGKIHPTPKSDEFSAQFGAEGLSLKIALPKWAKTVVAILLAIGFLESIVVVKAIEIHDRYEQSQIAHDRLVKQLTEQVQKAEKERQNAEEFSQAGLNALLAIEHRQDEPVGTTTVDLPHGKVTLTIFRNQDILISRTTTDAESVNSWLIAPRQAHTSQ